VTVVVPASKATYGSKVGRASKIARNADRVIPDEYAPRGIDVLNGSHRLTHPPFSPERGRVLKEISDLKATFKSKNGTFVPELDRAPIDPKTGERIFGRYNSRTNTITLYKDFDLSTVAHELLHFRQALGTNRLGRNLAKSLDHIDILERQVTSWLFDWGFTPRF
jgi:hypothetical protein